MKIKLFAGAFLLVLMSAQIGLAQKVAEVPNPILIFIETESHTSNGKTYIRYRFDVFNKDSYPTEMFAASPSLPPCGTNTKASRTWVDIYDSSGSRLNGFCALTKPGDIRGIWFQVEAETLPPSWIYIKLTDRQTGKKYKSNLAETVM